MQTFPVCVRVSVCVCMRACLCIRVHARMHVLTDRVGVLMLKWSTHPDRPALLQAGLYRVTYIDTVLHTVYYCRFLSLCLIQYMREKLPL